MGLRHVLADADDAFVYIFHHLLVNTADSSPQGNVVANHVETSCVVHLADGNGNGFRCGDLTVNLSQRHNNLRGHG